MIQPKTKANPKLPHQASTFTANKVSIRMAYHAHTGKRLPFYCTSYAILFFLIAFTTLFIIYISQKVVADQQQQGSISLSGTIQGNPPEIPAKITAPANSTHFKQPQIEVKGSCLENSYVEVYRRSVYAGTALCSTEGAFSLTISLLPGANELFAKTRDSLNQYGPDSAAITVYLDVAKKAVASNAQNVTPVLLTMEPVQKGARLNQEATIEYEISGDQAPYAVSIDWGDGSAPSLYSYPYAGKFTASHVTKKSGQIVIHISVLGAGGTQAVLQTILVVEGEGGAAATNSPTNTPACASCIASTDIELIINRLWLPLSIATLMTISFWLGEKIVYSRLAPR